MYIKHSSVYNEIALKLPVFEGSSPFFIYCAGITYPNKNYRCNRPGSDVTVIDYIISGEGIAILNNKHYRLKPGDTCIGMIEDDQYYYSSADNPWKKIWVCFKGPVAPALADAYSLRKQTVFHCNTEPFLRKIHEIAADTTLTANEINNKCAQVFLELVQFMSSHRDRENISPEAEIIKNHIDMHIYEPLKIEDLAQLIYKSNAQTIRIFKNAYGATPYEYYTHNKIKKAKHLLKTSGMSIKEISFSLGFTDVHYFSKLFKKKVGKTPSEFRSKKTYR